MFKNSKKFLWPILVLAIFLVIFFLHLWKLDSIPRGLDVDETSNGYNAQLIALTGHDEWGRFLPLYFKEFGEYTDPVTIYSTSVIFKISGVSVFNLRLVSFIFFAIFLISFFYLCKNIFEKNKIIWLYSLISAGTLPWFFNTSRVALVTSAALPFLALTLLFTYKIYEQKILKNPVYGLLTGLLLGLSFYTYGPLRLLAVFFLLTVILIYFKKSFLKQNFLLGLGFMSSMIPALVFLISNRGALSLRFSHITYIFSSMSVYEKFVIFIKNYISYFSTRFLIFSGDPNFGYHTLFRGEIFIIIYFLAIIGLSGLVYQYFKTKNKFLLLILINFILSPVPAALTNGDYFSYRSITLGIYILLISCYGLFFLSNQKYKLIKIIMLGILCILILESFLYLRDYFTNFPARSEKGFLTYGFDQAFQKALNQKPKKIFLFQNESYPTYTHLEFYKYIFTDSQNILLEYNRPFDYSKSSPSAEENSCIISHLSNNIDNSQGIETTFISKDGYFETTCFR